MNTRVSIRFAKALLDLAIEQKKKSAVFADITLILKAIEDSKELSNLLKSPVIKADKKQSITSEIFGSKISEMTAKFIEIVISKGRESLLADICKSYISLHKSSENITSALVTSAVKLDEQAKKKIAALLKVDVAKLEIEEKIDPSVVGGFVVKVGDKQIDTTVKSKLLNIKHEFSANLYESKL